jgi:hypothetical protein
MAFEIPKEAFESEFPNWKHQWGGGIYNGIFTQQNKNFYAAFDKLLVLQRVDSHLHLQTSFLPTVQRSVIPQSSHMTLEKLNMQIDCATEVSMFE